MDIHLETPNNDGSGSKFEVVSLSATDKKPDLPKIEENKSGGWVAYGDKNLFPMQLLSDISNSSTHNSIIDSVVNYTCGKGLKRRTEDDKRYIGNPNTSQSWEYIIRRIAKDYYLFGGFYCQIILNKNGNTVSIFHEDYTRVRVGQTDEYNRPVTFRIANDWKKTSGKNKPIEIEVWRGVNEAVQGKAYMFYYWDYVPSMQLYSIPRWYNGLDSIRVDSKLGRYYVNAINNNFTPSAIVSIASNPDKETKQTFVTEVKKSYTGEENAGKILFLFGESDTNHTKVMPFNATNNPNIFNAIESICFQKIITAHRLSSPTLAGVSGGGNLSGNAAEIIDSFILYNYTVVEEIRSVILEQLNAFAKINKLDNLEIEELDVIGAINKAKNPQQISSPTEEKTLAEKLGVDGIQALNEVLSSQTTSVEQKRAIGKIVFGLTDEQIMPLVPDAKSATPIKEPAAMRRKRTPSLFRKIVSILLSGSVGRYRGKDGKYHYIYGKLPEKSKHNIETPPYKNDREGDKENESKSDKGDTASADKSESKVYSDKKTGGSVTTNTDVVKQSEKSKNEKSKYEKNLKTAKVMAQSGHKVQLVSDTSGGYDALVDGVPAEFKSTKSHNNIVKYGRNATQRQGAKIAVFELINPTDRMYRELYYLKSRGIDVRYYISGSNKIKSI